MTRFTALDAIVLVAYLAGTTALGLWVGRRQRDAKDYFVADRAIPWWAVMFSIVASETSALTFISTPGLSYGNAPGFGNLGFLQVVAGYILGRIVVAVVLLPRYFQGNLVTAYALLETRFGLATRRFTSIVFMVTRALADSVRVFATAIPVALIISPSVTNKTYVMPIAVLLLGMLTVIYTYKGGMKAVVWTELVQATVYISGGAAALVILGELVPGGWSIDLVERERRRQDAGDRLRVHAVEPAHRVGRPDRRRLPRHGVARHRPAHRAAADVVALAEGRAARDHRIGHRRVLPVLPLPDDRARAVGVLSGARLPAHRPDLPDVHPRAHAAGAGRADRRGDRRRDDEHALGRDQLARRRDDARHLSAAQRTHRPTIRRRCAWAGCSRSAGASVLTLGALLFPQDTKTPVVVVALGIASFTYGGLLGGFALGIFWRRAIQRDAIIGMSVAIATMAFIVFAQADLRRRFPRWPPRSRRSRAIAWPWYVLIGTAITLVVGMLSSLTHPMPAPAPVRA